MGCMVGMYISCCLDFGRSGILDLELQLVFRYGEHRSGFNTVCDYTPHSHDLHMFKRGILEEGGALYI